MKLPRTSLGLIVVALFAFVAVAEARAAVGPGAPVNLTSYEGSQWQPRNGFGLTWVNPSEAGTGIWEAELRIVDLADGVADPPSIHSISRAPRILGINLPHRGVFRAEVRLRDGRGNFGPVESTFLRLDDLRPGDVTPMPARGWLSADEFPYQQEFGRAEPGGPSGIAGYAVKISGIQGARPCPSGICLPGELTLDFLTGGRTLRIDRLAEGVHWVSAVAVSGAGLSSAVPRTERLRVDRTEPISVVRGVPQGWADGPVEVEVTASDSGSGMEARPEVDNGDPVTVIRAGGDPARVAQGNRASLRVSDEGVTRVRYWARDLAGNANDGGLGGNGEVHDLPGEAIVRIDRRSPVVSLVRERDPEDPEMLRAVVRDSGSGMASGTIGFREYGVSDEFKDLDTSIQGDVLTARLPSDELPPGGYEIRAEALDRAGNRGVSDDFAKSPVLEVPLKRPTRVSVRIGGRPVGASRIRVESGRTTRITGQVTGRGSGAFAGLSVIVEQEFADGSPRARTTEATGIGRNGQFSTVLDAGPSRTVRVRFAGTRTDQPSLSRELNVRASDRVRFRVSPALLVNGGTATMSGRVLGRDAPRLVGGKLVAIQYFDPARDRWRPVEVIRTDPRGWFKYRYRFRTISFAQKILFRAVSLPEAGWPFESSSSPRRPVVVYPSR